MLNPIHKSEPEPAAPAPSSSAHPENLDAPIAELDLNREVAALWPNVDETGMGHMARTLVRQPTLRVVLMVLRSGSVIREHSADGASSLQVLSGRVTLCLPNRKVDLASGQLLAMEARVPHDVEALEDSAVLLTLSWQPS
jgi:quercetin dioxygenase-like cupin family protein